jgi:hypothetical protein
MIACPYAVVAEAPNPAPGFFSASNRRVAAKLIDALAFIESSRNERAVGDGGRALGLFQIHRGVIADVNRHYDAAFSHRDALNQEKAVRIFVLYISLYATEARLGREVLSEDVALIWHLGPTGFSKIHSPKYRQKADKYLTKLRAALRS